MRALGRPLSKTETSELLASVATNGVQAMPGSNGSLKSEKGSEVIVSPTRVPPPSLEKTVRPSSASWPPSASKASMAIMSLTADGGMITS